MCTLFKLLLTIVIIGIYSYNVSGYLTYILI